MCLTDETVFDNPIEEEVVCWKVFHCKNGELSPVFYDFQRNLQNGEKLEAIKGYFTFNKLYYGWHAFLSLEDANIWIEDFNKSSRSPSNKKVVKRVILNKIIAIGNGSWYKNKMQHMPCLRAIEMTIASNQDFTIETEEFVGAAT